MLNEGFDADEAALEINTALAGPYLQGSARLRNRLRKRDWTYPVYGQLSRMRASGAAVERRERLHARRNSLSSTTFSEPAGDYHGRIRLVAGAHAMEFRLLRRERCGDCEVEVQFGRESDPNYEINQAEPGSARCCVPRICGSGQERSQPTNDFYMTANNTSR